MKYIFYFNKIIKKLYKIYIYIYKSSNINIFNIRNDLIIARKPHCYPYQLLKIYLDDHIFNTSYTVDLKDLKINICGYQLICAQDISHMQLCSNSEPHVMVSNGSQTCGAKDI